MPFGAQSKGELLVDCEMDGEKKLACKFQKNNQQASTEVALDSNKKPRIVSMKGSEQLLDEAVPKILKRIKVEGADTIQSGEL